MKTAAVLAVLAVLTVTVSLALAGEVLTSAGTDAGKIKEITGGDNGVVKLGDKEIPVSDVIRLDFGNKKDKCKVDFLVVMTNGDRIAGDFTSGDKSGVVVSTGTLAKRKVSIDNLLAFFNLAHSPESSFVEETAALNNTADIIFLTGEQRTEGAIKRITEKDVIIEVEELGEISLSYDKIRAVKLAPLTMPKPVKGLRATAYLTDGSRISGKLSGYKDGKLNIDWFNTSVGLEESTVMSVYFSGGKFTYLSDLKPAGVKETPFFDNFLYRYQLDHSLVCKQTISLRGKKYFKGVSVHSKTELTYDLDKQYSRFVSTIGIDDEARGKGDVVFVIYADGKELLRSKNITGKTEPKLLNLPVEGVKELKLVVDFGKDLDTMDRAVWADAVLVRK